MAHDSAWSQDTLIAQLTGIVGSEHLKTDAETCAFYTQDIWSASRPALFVASPANTAELSAIVAACASAGVPLNPRGGGMSYTGGFLAERTGTGLIDTARMDRVLEVNATDMFVRVEAGCTWKTLHDALKPHGLRTPFWGPLSGISSTIGGGLSQNNAFFGAGTYGTTAESALSLTVVLADGQILRTGSASAALTDTASPFYRHYGPDLTGLFLGDCGAFGIKAEATLRLIPTPEYEDWASFEFTTRDACARAMAAIMRENLACELFGFDPELSKVRMRRASLLSDAKALANVVTGQGNLLKGLTEGAKVALAGRQFMTNVAYTLHFAVEGRSKAGVSENTARLKKLAGAEGGKEIENSIPKIIRANPFTPLNNVLGPEGERWVPVHGLVPVSKGAQVWADIDVAFAALQPEFDRTGVQTGFLITSLSTTGFLIEPVFLWPEARFALHESTVEPAWLKRLPVHAENPEVTALVARARKAVIDIFIAHGGTHFQIGRAYPYFESRLPVMQQTLCKLKAMLDPHNRINPGVLGLGGEA